MAISNERAEEFKLIMKEEYDCDMSVEDAKIAGDQLVSMYEILIKLYLNEAD